ncbi:hypothetical protein M422DRAFT_55053 [Sphaerobolus stellatus SS14]|uniref:Dynamin N-terminal domain-containing protein n=1 Tax=Sphaerobolus stellatus (strain SS14) TaxID=990650 RepID=A0A0C9UEK7_SPHS4|nr:hypothetical protein M422DRAFT_55053 [Sphaerobolus stellatus SS14]
MPDIDQSRFRQSAMAYTGYKENAVSSSSVHTNQIRVKPESTDGFLDPFTSPFALDAQNQFVKPEPVEPLQDFPSNVAPPIFPRPNIFHQDPPPRAPSPPRPLYTVYETVNEIAYSPEEALKQGVGMVKAIKDHVLRLELGSKIRKDVWLREITGLEQQGSPTTLVAVCGATGAGKSSLLNAILDVNIVPTSGMRACTAVVTEISYQDKPTIDADVSFLSREEWQQELEVLLDDLVDEDGNLRRATDLRSEAGVAWHKVHAVYPSLTQDQIARMTADQIIERDPII